MSEKSLNETEHSRRRDTGKMKTRTACCPNVCKQVEAFDTLRQVVANAYSKERRFPRYCDDEHGAGETLLRSPAPPPRPGPFPREGSFLVICIGFRCRSTTTRAIHTHSSMYKLCYHCRTPSLSLANSIVHSILDAVCEVLRRHLLSRFSPVNAEIPRRERSSKSKLNSKTRTTRFFRTNPRRK